MKIKICRLEIKEEYIDIKKITNIQMEYITLIEKFKMKNKRVPSIREICKMKNNTPATTFNMLQRLYKKGYNYKLI